MFLTRIEINGFKSFADKTVIDFTEGVTAIVGPNGSGKSNLSEAIRWVLGEQSARSLRGDRMEDVVFNGTVDRAPVNIAQVTLVLNNEHRYLDYDFNEISITRSYNRNGDSHYLINNERVRLKDIVDLLLDSGFGRNSFGMISQGEIEQIFLSRPEERRSIIEEAAGVQRYQQRKIEASRKLDRSSDHLSRVKDIIHELEGQLEPLAKQRESALKYQELQETFEGLELSLLTQEIDQFQSQRLETEQTLNGLNDVLDTNNQTIQKKNEALIQQHQELEELVLTIDQRSDELQKQVQHIEILRGKLQMAEQEHSFNQSTQKSQEDQKREYLERQEAVQGLLERQERARFDLQQTIDDLQKRLKKDQEESSLLQNHDEEQVEQFRNQLIDDYQRQATINNQLQQLVATQDRSQRRSQQLLKQKATLEGQLEAVLEEEARLEKSQTSSQETVTALAQKVSEGQAQLESQTQEGEQVQQAIFQAERHIQRLLGKVSSLEDLEASYSGYYAGVRAIMQRKEQFPGINGTVAELMRVPADYQTAIETALGGSLQQIVVQDDQTARQAIAYLRENRSGRATFLPRTNIQARQLRGTFRQQAQNHPGYVGIASELVEVADHDRLIAEHLLGATVVMAQLSDAQSLASATNHRMRIVTLDGEILNPGGSVSGGRQRNDNSLLAREQQLHQAKETLEKSQKDYQALEADIQSKREQYQEKRQEVMTLQKELESVKTKAQEVASDYQQVVYSKQQAQDQLSLTEADLKELEEETSQLQEQEVDLQEQLTKIQATIQEKNDDLEKLNLDKDDREEALNQLQTSIRELSTDLAVANTQFKATQEETQRYQEELAQIQQWLIVEETSTRQQAQDVATLNDQITSLQEEIETLTQAHEKQQKDLKDKRQSRVTMNEAIVQLEGIVQELQAANQKHYQEQARCKAQVEQLIESINAHLNQLNNDYKTTYEAAKEAATPLEDSASARQELNRLRRQINGLGPINLESIEDYDILNERYQHLTEQESDLLTAIAQLEDTIRQMDQEVIVRFKETFETINAQFKITFQKLFGGGQASLQLTDPEDLLTTGIDIIAQPPGKKKQNLSLLSGGERTLTAIALLFAILETHPTPFVLLDEVEAALDEANVSRFGEYLQTFTDTTQFIVITHRRGTMENADILYGVTMEQSGVSKLASVRLTDVELDEV